MTDRHALIALAHQHGFHEVRFAAVGPLEAHATAYRAWLEAGYHGEMDYLARDPALREDPTLRMADARTVMVLAVDHHHERPPRPEGRVGRVARYAWGRDYHNLVGKRLKRLRRDLRLQGVESWGAVDTAPILERAWAQRAGMGFQGRNAVMIRTGTTSFTVLAVVFLPLDLPPDRPLGDHCGRCRRCLDACPTDAFVADRTLDARRCIAYWTIEARGLPPEPLRGGFGDWVFGCDVCQEVCPHNHHPPRPDEDDLLPRHAWLDLDELLATDDEALMERFLGTPLRRPGAAGLKRNAALVLGNLGDPEAARALSDHGLTHPSAVVQEAARWALERLA